MIVKTFEYVTDPDEYVTDPEFGTLGWRLKGAPVEFNAGDGRTVAHDVIEHFWDGKTDRWEDELLALGAMIFVRWESGYLSGRYYSGLGENLSADLEKCLEFIANERDIKPISTYRLKDDGIEADIEEAIRLATKEFIEYVDGDVAGNRQMVSENSENIKGWIRTGYRRARRRYRSIAVASSLFDSISRQVDRMMADEFDEIKIIVNIRRCSAEVKRIERDDYYL